MNDVEFYLAQKEWILKILKHHQRQNAEEQAIETIVRYSFLQGKLSEMQEEHERAKRPRRF